MAITKTIKEGTFVEDLIVFDQNIDEINQLKKFLIDNHAIENTDSKINISFLTKMFYFLELNSKNKLHSNLITLYLTREKGMFDFITIKLKLNNITYRLDGVRNIEERQLTVKNNLHILIEK